MWSVASRLSMEAKKKKRAPPPAAAQSSSSSSSSSSDKDQFTRSDRTQRHDDQSDSHSGSHSDPNPNPNPPIKTLTPQKRSEPEDSSEEEDEEGKQEETVEIQPTQKLLEPKDSSEEDKNEEVEQEKVDNSPQSPSEKQKDPSTKKSSAVQRIWSLEDEMTLLRALSDYQLKNGKLPPSQDYASLISTISNSISFNVTVKQLYNKMRTMRFNYNQNKNKGSNLKFSTSHGKTVFELCTKLYENDSNASSKEGASQETNCDAEIKRDSKRKKGRSYFYLEGLIKDMISTHKRLRWFSTVEEVVEQIGESRAHDLEAKTKILQMDAIKLHAREENLIAELFEIFADEMMDD